ncbi:MAG: DUF1007 family protein [Reyranellaceae bacterium]
MRLPAAALLLGVLLPLRQGAAHPHVFIDWHIEPLLANGGIAAVKLFWRFDDFYSDLVLDTVDRDRDRRLSRPEIDAIAARTLANLQKARFYASVILDGAAWQAEKAEHFTATVEGDHLVYVFTLKLPAPARAVSVSSLDPEYYIEMQADKRQPLSGAGFACTAGRGKPVKTETWGSITPDTVTCGVK